MTDDLTPLGPVVGPSNAWPTTTAEFRCDRCGGRACTLALVPPFARDPRAGPPGVAESPPGVSSIGAENVRLSIDGPLYVTH